MRYYVTVYSIQGKNNLQKALIMEAEKWGGTLIEEEGSKEAFIDHMRKVLNHFNRELPKCRPCEMSTNDNSISFSTQMTDDTFATLTLHEVKYVYDGIMRYKEKKGGNQ